MLDDGGDPGEPVPQLTPVDPASYKAAMRQFASGVTVITTLADDVDHAMTATAFSAVSLAPPLVLVCVDVEARIHQALQRTAWWGVSMLPATSAGREVSDWLARKGRPLRGQLDRFDVVRGVTGSALLVDAIARLECRTTASHPAGDHTIVVGEVVAADSGGPGVGGDSGGPGVGVEQLGPGVGVEQLGPGVGPLVHHDGGYRSIG